MLKNLYNRVVINWKTTIGGTALGILGASLVHYVLVNQAGCNFGAIDWPAVSVYAFTQLQGALSTDNSQTV